MRRGGLLPLLQPDIFSLAVAATPGPTLFFLSRTRDAQWTDGSVRWNSYIRREGGKEGGEVMDGGKFIERLPR